MTLGQTINIIKITKASKILETKTNSYVLLHWQGWAVCDRLH